MKTIRKNLLLLAFAFGALFLIGNNVFAGEDPNESEDTGDGVGGTTTKRCWGGGHGRTAWAYACVDPGYPTLPSVKCSSTRLYIVGHKYWDCW